MVILTKHDRCVSITLHPNRSASWSQTKKLMLLISVFVVTIALGWFLVGAWLILPFAGFEVGLLALLMYKVSHFTYQTQHINIDENAVSVRLNKTAQVHQFTRWDCHIEYDDANDHWHLPCVKLVGNAKTIEVGDFLNLEDRQRLKCEFEQAGLVVCKKKWWTSH